MKPGFLGGCALAAFVLLAAHQADQIANGELWAIPALIWDVSCAFVGIFKVFPALSSALGEPK